MVDLADNCSFFFGGAGPGGIFFGKAEKYQRQDSRPKLLDYGDTMRTEGLGQGGYLQENFTADVTDGLGGTVRWHNNASGFRNDQEFSQEPPPGVLRILSMGDSFAAGYRVGQDETFSFLREQWLNQKLGKTGSTGVGNRRANHRVILFEQIRAGVSPSCRPPGNHDRVMISCNLTSALDPRGRAYPEIGQW